MFAVHSFATHSSAAAFRPVVRRCVSVPAIAARGRRARSPSAADCDVALSERREANRARVEPPPADVLAPERAGSPRAIARRVPLPERLSARDRPPSTPSGTRR